MPTGYWTDTCTTQGTSADIEYRIYNSWIDEYKSSLTTTSTNVWRQWYQGNFDATTSATTTTNYQWRTWSDSTGGTATGRIIQPHIETFNINNIHTVWVAREVEERNVLSAAERAARQGDVNVAVRAAQRERSIAQQQRIAREADRKRVSENALKRSLLLLQQACNDEQIDQLKEEGSIVVVGKSGTRYRVTDRGTMANVHVLKDNNKVSHRLCAHPLGVPQGDIMLAQKLMLEHDEANFLKVANRHLA